MLIHQTVRTIRDIDIYMDYMWIITQPKPAHNVMLNVDLNENFTCETMEAHFLGTTLKYFLAFIFHRLCHILLHGNYPPVM